MGYKNRAHMNIIAIDGRKIDDQGTAFVEKQYE